MRSGYPAGFSRCVDDSVANEGGLTGIISVSGKLSKSLVIYRFHRNNYSRNFMSYVRQFSC